MSVFKCSAELWNFHRFLGANYLDSFGRNDFIEDKALRAYRVGRDLIEDYANSSTLYKQDVLENYRGAVILVDGRVYLDLELGDTNDVDSLIRFNSRLEVEPLPPEIDYSDFLARADYVFYFGVVDAEDR